MSVRSKVRSRVILGFFFLFNLSFSQSVKTINENELNELLSKRNGKLLFLNIWATWCEPCKEEFPDIIKLFNDLKKKDVEFVAISVDYPDEIDSKITPFIDTLNIPFTVYVSDFPSQESFIDKFGTVWNGAIPATFIYDGKGQQQKFLSGKQNYRQFKKSVEDILRKP